MTLTIPNKIANLHNTSQTFKPYDPNEAIGDTAPTRPKPGKNCGVFGQILLAVIAIVVAAVTFDPLVAFAQSLGFGSVGATVAGGALAGAAGSIASQAVGVATGIQKSFNWGGVALAAIGGAVGGAIGPNGLFGKAGMLGSSDIGSFGVGLIRGVVSNVVTQGIGVATGLQKKFDWAGVAAAGVGGGVFSAVQANIGLGGPGSPGNTFAASTASMIVGAAIRTLINGSDFGDNIIAGLPDVIGQTISGLLAQSGSDSSSDDVAASTDDGQFVPPTRSHLEGLHGKDVTKAMIDAFTDGTDTTYESSVSMDPAMVAYLKANQSTDDQIAAEVARLIKDAHDGNLKAYYDFNYSDPHADGHFEKSMASMGDEKAAIRVALAHYNIDPTDANVDMVYSSVYVKGSDVKFPTEQEGLFHSAVTDIQGYKNYSTKFFDGLARTSLAVNLLGAFAATDTKKYAGLAQASADMRAAIDHGYFTMRPGSSYTSGGHNAAMAQFNTGGESEIVVYDKGAAWHTDDFAIGLFHEVIHAASWQDKVIDLDFNPPGTPTAERADLHKTVYSDDPKKYYDAANRSFPETVRPGEYSTVKAVGQDGGTEPVNRPTRIVADYEKGHLFEGNIMNWYSRSVLRAANLAY
jgi:hypothetical protein